MPAQKPLHLRVPALPAETAAQPATSRAAAPWRLLIVDDEKDVHAVTRLIFTKTTFKNRPIEILSAYSAKEAEQILKDQNDIAVILLDVVMETDNAGLKLVKTIREDMGNSIVRIILRTGQPGQAPEEHVIVEYDINDYKTKSELTAQKLFTTVIAALRSYETLVTLSKTKAGLEKILNCTDSLLQLHSVRELASGILTQLGSFLDCKPEGIICIEEPLDSDFLDYDACHLMKVIASMGNYSPCLNCNLDELCLHKDIVTYIQRALVERRNIFNEHYTVLYLETDNQKAIAALVNSGDPVDENDQSLLTVFASKISIALANVIHYQKMISFEEAATTDFLTGLNNRRQLLRLGIPLLAGANRHQNNLAVAMLDIDHFKDINDTYGHDAGDVVLKQIGNLLAGRFRSSDVVSRYGGEEFCIIAPQIKPEQAYVLFNEFRETLSRQRFELPNRTLFITVSIGVATRRLDNLDDMISEADALLYEAKQAGRNCVRVSN